MADESEHDFRQGAKAAAAAAAVAAAAGVARAIAAHAHDSAQAEEPDERGEPEEQERQQEQQPEQEQPEERAPVHGTGVGRVRTMTEQARSILTELSGVEPESVSAVDRTSDGWRITLEVVELRRVPDSTDVLASYEVDLDGDGELLRYERRRRYSRSQSDDGSGR